MQKKIIILMGILVFNSPLIHSQQVILEENVLKDTVKRNFGQNLKHFAHVYLGYSVVIGQTNSKDGEIIPGLSNNFDIGLRYKYKISNFYSIGSEFSYNINSYSIKQENGKRFPDEQIHKNETLKNYALSLGIYNRFNFGKRGNYIGKFIDLGINGDWCYSIRHLYKDDLGSNIKSRTVIKGLRFCEPFYYGLYGNIGFNRIVFTFRYRMSNIFKSKYNFPEMPPLTIGLQAGLH